MEFIRTFERLGKGDASIAGGKGASLGEMTQAGIPVPPGFVILTGAFERFLEEADLNQELDAILHSVKHDEIHTVENASEKIQALILTAPMPEDSAREITRQFRALNAEFVAVRSSATAEDGSAAAWAGQLDTFLNTTEETLLKNVQRCWASLFTPRAIFYRFEKGMHGHAISVAVVVQKMVQSEVSGIAFSVHPVTEDRNQLIIEAGFGLGEAIVSGQVTPDSYVVEKSPRRIIDKNISTQSRALYRGGAEGNEWREIPESRASSQALSDERILELSELVLRIEKHYGFPCDIEWAFEAGEFFITQSRPITTLSIQPDNLSVSAYGQEIAAALDAKRWDYVGLYPSSVFSRWFWCSWDDAQQLREAELPALFYGAFTVRGGHWFWSDEMKRGLLGFIREKITRDNSYFSRVTALAKKEFEKGLQFIETLDFNVAEPADFLRIVSSRKKMQFFWSLGSVVSHYYIDGLLTEAAIENGVPLADLGQVIPKPDTPMVQLQQELAELRAAIPSSGHGLSSSEMLDRIHADLELATRMKNITRKYDWIQDMNWTGEAPTEEQFALLMAAKAADETKSKSSDLPKSFQVVADAAGHVGFWRQSGAEHCSIFEMRARPYLERIASRIGVSYADLLWCTPDEIVQNNTFKGDCASIASRRASGEAIVFTAQNGSARVVDPDSRLAKEAFYLIPHVDEKTTQLKGETGYRGTVRARVRVVITQNDFARFQEGEVLVAPMTTPDYLLLMQRASAIVTDIGGLLSHAAIVARELKKPCIIGTKFATQVLKDGDMVEVDAERGVVRILKTPEFRVSDYELTFEGQGMSYLYENALFKYYLPPDSVSVIKKGVVQEFMSKKKLAQMDAEGLQMGPGHVREAIRTMSEAVTRGRAGFEALLEKPLIPESIQEAFGYSGAVTAAYYAFDPHFWDSLFERAKTDADAKEAVNLVQEYKNKARDEFNDFHFGRVYLPRLLEKIGAATGVPTADLSSYGEEELARLIAGERVPQGIIDARKNAFSMVKGESGITVHVGEEAHTFAENFYANAEIPAGAIVKGKGAHFIGTIVRGRACLITRDYGNPARMLQEMADMRQGDILVTQTTDPEMMPALRKASAAVTDIGGMLSHTAITARELNIPCIVDTKSATRLIKNGDMVEVDAEKGIVRIIEQNKKPHLVFEKSITRDWGVVYAEVWHRVFTEEFKKQLGWGYTEVVFESEDNAITVYRAPEEHIDGMRDFILAQLDRDRTWLLKHAEVLKKDVDATIAWVDQIEKKVLSRYSQKELADIFKVFIEKNLELGPRFIMMLWFPIQMEQHDKRDNYADAIKIAVETRSYIEKIGPLVDTFARKVAQEMLRRAGLEKIFARVVASEDIAKYFRDGVSPNPSVLRARQSYCLVTNEGVIFDRLESYLHKNRFSLKKMAIAGLQTITGNTAYAGVVRGAVKIIRNKESLRKLQKGEILVTGMTTPDFMPILHLAAAIVTDEGGITCHAAIVARELKKPCIIGTKIATRVLKDGDVVEVDANKGVVTVLK